MRKQTSFLIAILGLMVVLTGYSFRSGSGEKNQAKGTIPENVDAVLQKTCFGCHNSNSQNEKSKAALNLAVWETLTKQQKTGKLKEIAEVLSEGTMPPSRFLERFPDKKLTPEEKKLLIDWAKAEAKK